MKKAIFIGICIYILGFIFIGICSNIFASGDVEHSYYYGIIFSILYLSSVVGFSSSLILKELRKNQNH